MLRGRLAAAEDALAAGRPSITVGGKRLWRTRHHLDTADMTEQQWRQRWDAARMFLTADGESGKAGGNETIRVDEHGRLRIKAPAALADELGTHLTIAAPVGFTIVVTSGRRGWVPGGRCATTLSTTPSATVGTWMRPGKPPRAGRPGHRELRAGPVLGVDLNDGHLACCVLDGSGNPIGAPHSIDVVTAGLCVTA